MLLLIEIFCHETERADYICKRGGKHGYEHGIGQMGNSESTDVNEGNRRNRIDSEKPKENIGKDFAQRAVLRDVLYSLCDEPFHVGLGQYVLLVGDFAWFGFVAKFFDYVDIHLISILFLTRSTTIW